ncbi:MAG: hypothetical protein O2807_12540 [bacterium]|nr:hypothetical protein [bacterium]
MKILITVFSCVFVIFSTVPAYSEILAMMNYESKTKAALKKMKIGGSQKRVEGIAIIDVDPNSPGFGKILVDIPLPPDVVAHHIFYDKTMTKAYVTSLGKSLIYVIDMKRNPYRLKKVDVPACKVGEDVVFSSDNSTWYLTCMGSGNVVVGDVKTDRIKTVIPLPRPHPHGIAIHNGIDRILVTETVRASDLGDAGETVTVIQASTNKVLSTHKISGKTSPSREAPVEVVFMPKSNPPVAYITNMFGGTLWMAAWQPGTKTFQFSQAFDFGKKKMGVPLEIYGHL